MAESGGAFRPNADYNITGAWDFATPPTSGAGNSAVGTTATQTLTNKTLTSPAISAPTITGVVQSNAAAAAAGGITEVVSSHTLTDNTATTFFTVTVPNAIHGASVDLYIASALGDGDSTDSCRYSIGISRIAGAASKMVASTKSVVGATAGATANAVITASVSGPTGANGATQTWAIQIKNARSAGAADNHPTTAIAKLVNLKATGVTIVAA